MKIIVFFLVLASTTLAQNEHVQKFGCAGDAALWINEPTAIENYRDSSPLRFAQLAQRYEELRTCAIVFTQQWLDKGKARTPQEIGAFDMEKGRYMTLMARYETMMRDRLINYLTRHDEIEKFKAEDGEGMR